MTQNLMAEPLRIGGIQLTETGLTFDESTTWEHMAEAARRIRACGKAWRWWVGDWLLYGEGRPEWGDDYGQIEDAFGVDYLTLKQYKTVAKRVPIEARHQELDWSYHRVVAKLPPKEQQKLLKKALPKDDGEPPRLTSAELSKELKKAEIPPEVETDGDAIEQDLRFEIAGDVASLGRNLKKLVAHMGEADGPQDVLVAHDHTTGKWRGWQE